MKRALAVSLVAAAALVGGFVAYVAWKAHDAPPRLGLPAPLGSIVAADPALGFALKPGLAVHHPTNAGRFWIFTNGDGLRVPRADASRLKAAAIVTLGDSQSFGYGIEDAQTYTSFLGRRFGAPTANLSVPGYNAVSALLALDRFRHLGPRVVVYGLYYGLFERNLNRCYPGFSILCISVPHLAGDGAGGLRVVPPDDNGAALYATGGYLRYASSPAEHDFAGDFRWTLWKTLGDLGRAVGVAATYRKEFPERDIARSMRFVLSLARRKAGEMGASLVLLYIPNYFVEPIAAAPEFLAGIARDLGLPLLDAAPALTAIKRANPRDPKVLEVAGDGHLTAAAHAAIGGLVADHLAANGLLDRRP
ncbi:MAG: hypothetical protein ACREB6_06030 [Rhodospirillales bacterium]